MNPLAPTISKRIYAEPDFFWWPPAQPIGPRGNIPAVASVITFDDGYVAWERTETSYWGHLEGITAHDQDTRSVPASKIIQTLIGRM